MGFPSPPSLHPFEAALLDLTVGNAMYRSTLQRVDSLRKSLQETGKAYASRASNAVNKRDAVAIAEEGFAAMEKLYRKGARSASRCS